jgi:hypothetical protein
LYALNKLVVVSDSKKEFGLGSLQWYQSLDPPNPWRDRCMQKYRGIVMGLRKKNNNEIEAEMEGLGDDHETQGLALLVAEFGKFQQNMNHTESTLVRKLDEYQKTNRRGQVEISETLKKVDENLQKMNKNQTRITDLMMQVTH